MNEDQPNEKPTYQDAKIELSNAAGRVRVYGVELGCPEEDSSIPIWYCGNSAGGTESRSPSKRIFHLPKSDVIQRGQVYGFEFDGIQVEWFDLDLRSRLLEERFVAFEAAELFQKPLGDLTALERLHGIGSSHLLPPAQLLHHPHPPVEPVPIEIPLDPPDPPNPVPIEIPV